MTQSATTNLLQLNELLRSLIHNVTALNELVTCYVLDINRINAKLRVLDVIDSYGEWPAQHPPWLNRLLPFRTGQDTELAAQIAGLQNSLKENLEATKAKIATRKSEIAALKSKIEEAEAKMIAQKSEIEKRRKANIIAKFDEPGLAVKYRLQDVISKNLRWMTQVQVDDKEKPWLLFHGPSGCGKTVAATHEVRKALDGLGVAQTTIYRALSFRGARTAQEKELRNDHALTFLSNLIPQCDSTNTSSLILVLDECTADIDLMRGVVASHVEARALAADRGYCHLLVVFAGIVLPSALNQSFPPMSKR